MPFYCFGYQRNKMLTPEYKYFNKDDRKNFQLPVLRDYCNKRHLTSHLYLSIVTKLLDSHKNAHERNKIPSSGWSISCNNLLHLHATDGFISETEEFSHTLRISEQKDWECEDWALSQFTHKRRQMLLIDAFQEQIILKVNINTVRDKAAGSRRHLPSETSCKQDLEILG